MAYSTINLIGIKSNYFDFFGQNYMKRNETKTYRSLVLLGSSLRELIEMNGSTSLCDEHGKLLDYINDKIAKWVKENYPDRKHILSENEIARLVNEILEYIITEDLLARDIEVNRNQCNADYYSDLYLINTNENEYGDKHSGISFRDNGSFGSLPLYDDYSEESEE